MKSPKKVIFATDFSDASEAALKHTQWLQEQGNIELVVLHIFDSAAMQMPTPYNLLPDDGWIVEKLAVFREKGKKAVAQLAESFGENVEGILIEGVPKVEIVDFAEERKADLIVMGTHGHAGWKRWILGSVAEYVVRHASCAVLTVPSKL